MSAPYPNAPPPYSTGYPQQPHGFQQPPGFQQPYYETHYHNHHQPPPHCEQPHYDHHHHIHQQPPPPTHTTVIVPAPQQKQDDDCLKLCCCCVLFAAICSCFADQGKVYNNFFLQIKSLKVTDNVIISKINATFRKQLSYIQKNKI